MPNIQPDVVYVNLQGNVAKVGLGGLTHVIGVVESMAEDGPVVLLSNDSLAVCEGIRHARSPVLPVEVGGGIVRVVEKLLGFSRPAIFIFRKTFLGLVAVSAFIFFEKIFLRRRHRYVVEVNGISGDYQSCGRMKSISMGVINSWLLSGFDAIYCVNDRLAQRLISLRGSLANRIIVCRNGCGPLLFDSEDVGARCGSKIDLIYLGSDLFAYDLDGLVNEFRDLKLALGSKCELTLNLIGPSLHRFSGIDGVIVHQRKTIEEVYEKWGKGGARVWGVLPLRESSAGSDVEPIKTFDYLRSGIPVLYSCYSLSETEGRENFGVEYDPARPGDCASVMSTLIEMNCNKYCEYARGARFAASAMRWPNRLAALREYIRSCSA